MTDAAAEHAMPVRVEVVELLGHETIVYGSIRGQRVATASTAAGIESAARRSGRSSSPGSTRAVSPR